MFKLLNDIRNRRDLLYMITWKEIRIKYKQSVMGLLWALLMPIFIVGAGVMVKFAYSSASAAEFSLRDVLSLLVRGLPWAFFISSLRFATSSLTANSSLVTKIAFPNEFFPLAAVLSQLFDLAVASAVLTVVLVLAQVGLSVALLWVPLILLMLVLLVSGMGLLLSAGNLFFRDVKYIVEVVVTFAIFFTPVFYDVDLLGRWKPLALLNPVSPLLEALDDCIVFGRLPELGWLAYSFGFSLLLFEGALALFNRLEARFAESI